MGETFLFRIIGAKPEPAGSKRAFLVAGRARISDANPLNKGWQALVRDSALDPWGARNMLEGSIKLEVRFVLERPKSHFTSKGNLTKGARLRPTGKPDLLKLARAVEDALTGLVWRDDAQIVEEELSKSYGPRHETTILVTPL